MNSHTACSENDRVSHYIVQRRGEGNYRMGDRDFVDLVDIIDFYKTHLLDSTTLSVVPSVLV